MTSPGLLGGTGGAPSGVSSLLPDLNDPLLDKLASYVRERMRDYEPLNRLTAKLDHSPRHIKWAIIDTMSDWSSTPPFIGQDLTQIMERNWFSVFSKGVIITCLESLGILHLRNFISYSDGGMNVQTENPQLIQAWLRMMKEEYETKKQRILIAANIENMLGSGVSGVHSEYFFTNSFYGFL